MDIGDKKGFMLEEYEKYKRMLHKDMGAFTDSYDAMESSK